MIKFRVNGIPAPQGSKRHVGNGRMVESSKAVGPWREAVRAEAQAKLERGWGHTQRRRELLICGCGHPLEQHANGTCNPGRPGFCACSSPRAGTPPLQVTIVFVLARPKSHYSTRTRAELGAHLTGVHTSLLLPSAPAYPAKRPDLDKLARAVLDGLVAGGVMADDSQVVSLNVAKVYASNGEAPGALIEVEAM